MSQLIYDFTHYQFLINALLASVFASIILGLLGPLIVVKRISSICGGIAHSALGGIGVAVFLGLSPMWGAFGASIASALIISYTKLKGSQHEDVMISVIWSLGMAIGLIFIALTPGYSQNILTYLFGNILLVTNSEIITSMLLSFLVFGLRIVGVALLLCAVFQTWFFEWIALGMQVATESSPFMIWLKVSGIGLLSGLFVYGTGEVIALMQKMEHHLHAICNKP
jgi:zinc transport system permease protein